MLGKQNPTALLLRLALAIVFLYAAVSSTMSPNEWVGYLPKIVTEHVSATLVLKFFSIFELALAVWLLSGLYVRYAALVAAAALAGITVSNYHLFIISFRDTGLMLAALALATLPEDAGAKRKR